MVKTVNGLKIVLNRAGVRQLLRSDEMLAECQKYADAAVSRLGSGYSVNTHRGKNRVNAEVHADTYAARKENLKTNSILKAVKG